MTRVALLPSAYLPHLGGVEELTRHLALALVSAGDDVEVWTQRDDRNQLPEVEVLDGLTVRRFQFPLPRAHPRDLGSSSTKAISSMRALMGAARTFRPDVLHVQCYGPNGAYATALSYMSGVPLMISLQGETVMDDHDIFERSTTLRTALRLGLRRSSAVTACSNFTLADAEQRFGLAPGTGHVIFNGVSLHDQVAFPARPDGIPVSRRYIFALGRLVQKKGFDLLLRAFAVMGDRHPDVDLVIAGAGPAESALRGLADELDLGDRVHLVGRLPRTEVAAAMSHSDLFVMPSRLEPFGIVVLEAWRAGTAAVATAIGGPPEYVRHGVNGFLVDPTDTERLADGLDQLLGSPDLRDRLATAALHDLRDFDWSVIARQYRSLYSALV